MKIEIIGTGCHNCIELDLLVAEVVRDLGLKGVEIQRVGDERRIRRYMSPEAIPGLVIDGVLVSERQVPEWETLTRWLLQA
jgi:hypothetical protein